MKKMFEKLLAADTSVPPEMVPEMLRALETLQKDMRTVDNHLLIIARAMIERKQAVEKQLRAERRAAIYNATLGLVGRAAKAVGRTTVSIATSPVRIVRRRFVRSIDEPKPVAKPKR